MSINEIAKLLQNQQPDMDIGIFLKSELLRRVCDLHNLDSNQLSLMPLGRKLKRKYHDDITVLVIDLNK